jgi:hypothetical protein
MKLFKTKEIVVIPLLLIILFSLLISNSINNQQVIAQFNEETGGGIREYLDTESIDNDTTTAITNASSDINRVLQNESSIQSLVSDSLLVYESPVYGIRTQFPEGWEILIQNTSNSSLSLIFNSPLENDTDSFRENVRLVIGTVSNKTALINFTSATLTSYLELYPDLELIELSPTNLTSNAIPAYKLAASRNQEGLNFMQIFAIKEDKIYAISYVSEKARYSTYLPAIEQMINSFEVTQ